MNKIVLSVAAIALSLAWTASTGNAQERPARERQAGRPAAARPGATSRPQARPDGIGQLRRTLQGLDLTADQKAKVAEIMKAQGEALKAWRAQHEGELRDLSEQMKKAREAHDRDAARAAGEKMKALLESRKALHEDLLSKLSAVLSDEQMAKVKQAFNPPLVEGQPHERLMNALGTIKLTPEQNAQVKAILSEAHAKAQSAAPEARREIWKNALEKIKADVLTPEQRDRLGKMPQKRDFLWAIQKLNLTDDQKKQIEQIRQEARQKVDQATTPEAKRQALQEGFKRIFDDVLTDQQRQELRKIHAQGAQAHPTTRPAHSGARK